MAISELSKAKKLIEKIVDLEEEMFKAVKVSEPSLCQERLKTFRIMREMTFSVWSIAGLESYLNDLKEAVKNGRNFLTEKYARMDNLIAVINNNPLIDVIVSFERDWMLDLHEQYPNAVNMQGDFTNYTKSELETYSDATLKEYYETLKRAKLEEINLAEVRFLKMYKRFGYDSLQEIEDRIVEKEGGR